MTIAEALNVSNRTVSFRDAEVLLRDALSCPREYLHTHPEVELTISQQKKYESYLVRRESNEPVAYITGKKEFYGRTFHCDKRALIPRPETEILIDRALALTKSNNISILELGTGVGNIAITLALEFQKRNLTPHILATDISSEALILAQENAQALGATPFITFIEADLFDHDLISNQRPFELIVANLPYVSTTWQTNPAAQPDVVFFEPDIALFGGEDGLDHYRNFLTLAPQFLRPNGHILFEYGEDQTPLMLPLVHAAFPDRSPVVHQDYAALDRLIEL